ncbi:methylated-DNA--protein-cysteine methyltransferase [Erysipelotrichaceae bacterium]|nr:methylated-DNA--protein-cysteine methyltransferase [Erysipelotrichaceae bacterium]
MYYAYFVCSQGILKIRADDEFLQELKFVDAYLEPVLGNKITDNTKKQLEEYFLGKRLIFDLPLFYPDTFSGAVLQALAQIPYGEVISYKQLASNSNSNAVRAVGSVLHKNRIPLILPCHRVIKSDGRIGAYAYGAEMKAELLLHEQQVLGKQSDG